MNSEDMTDRSHLGFETKVKEAFAFLDGLGFSTTEALPTLVRYRKSAVEVDIYHGRQSYEIGAGITMFGKRYAISEIIRVKSHKEADQYRRAVVTTSEGVETNLKELSSLMKCYGDAALRGDSNFFSMLEEQRERWSEEYALDVLTEQLRPQANEAFRRKEYLKAAELYSRIRDRLSPAEIKKLSVAESRSN